MTPNALHDRFTKALDAVVEEIRQDRSILATLLCGSLSHDTVWEKSDIDLVLVTIDDRKIESNSVSLFVDGLNAHASLIPRSDFRKLLEGSLRNSFMHSLVAKGRLLYTHDESITRMCADLQGIGERDTRIQLFRSGCGALPSLYKAHKWMITRGDLDYTALFILYTATSLAQIEVLTARQLVDREVILQATTLNPEFLKVIYHDLLNTRKTQASVQGALDLIDAYLKARANDLFAPLLEYLEDAGEPRSATEIDTHFTRTAGIGHVTTACEYLADLGTIGKVSTAVQLTRKSNVSVQELAFVHLGRASGGRRHG